MSKKKTILFIITGLGVGGAERSLLRILPNMKDFNYHIISLSGKNDLKEKFVLHEIPVTVIDLNKGFLKQIKVLKKTIGTINPDLIVSYLIHANIITRFITKLFFKKIKNISSVRSFYRGKQIHYFILDLLTSPLVDHYMVVTNSLKKTYTMYGISSKRISVVPNGIDISSIPFRKKEPEKIKLICVARLHPKKNHRDLLMSLSKVNKSIKIDLYLVGEGPEKESLQKLTRRLSIEKKVHFLGHRSDVLKLLNESTAFVLPTSYEGMSNSLLEAAAVGLPIITTNIPENKDVFIDNKSAILISPHNINDLQYAIEQISTDQQLREKLSKGSRQTALRFTIENTIERYQKLLYKMSKLA